jgi:hypothetical protein
VSWAAPKSATATWHFWVKDYVTGMPAVGAAVSLCNSTDIDCAAALATGTTDTAGSVSLTFKNVSNGAGAIELGLNGFMRITSPSLFPVYYYWGFPLSEAQIYSYWQVVTPAELKPLFAATNVTPDPNRGTVEVVVYDCKAAFAAAGVEVTLSSADTQTKSFNTTGVATSVTDTTGILAFDNVPTGDFELTATPLAIGKPASKVSANVRAGAITGVLVDPTP